MIGSKSNNNTDEMSNPGNKEVRLGSTSGKRLAFNAGKRFFNEKNSPFNKSAVTIEIIPVVGTAGNTGVKTQIFVRVSIRAFVGIFGARIVADTDGIRRTFDFDGFMADIFESG